MAGSTTLTIDVDYLNEDTLIFNKELVDGLYRTLPFLMGQEESWGKGAKPEWPAGKSRLMGDLIIGTHTNMTATPTGQEAIDLSQVQSKAQFVYSPGYTQQPIVISGFDRRMSGKQEQMRVWTQRVAAVHGNMTRKFEQQIIAGGVVGYADANWNSLNGVDRTYGFLEAAAPGAQSRTVGGLSKSTYASVPGMNNQYFDGADNAAANVLRAFHNTETQILIFAPEPDKVIWYLSPTCYDFLKQASLPLERFVDKAPNVGRRIEYINKYKCVVSSFQPVSTTYGGSASATHPVSAYAVDHKMIAVHWGGEVKDNLGSLPSGMFGVTEATPVDGAHDMVAAKKQAFGQLAAFGLASSAVVSDLETWT